MSIFTCIATRNAPAAISVSLQRDLEYRGEGAAPTIYISRFTPVAYIYCRCIWPCLAIRVQAQSHAANKYRKYLFVVLPGAMALPSECCRQYAWIDVSFLPSLAGKLVRALFPLVPCCKT